MSRFTSSSRDRVKDLDFGIRSKEFYSNMLSFTRNCNIGRDLITLFKRISLNCLNWRIG